MNGHQEQQQAQNQNSLHSSTSAQIASRHHRVNICKSPFARLPPARIFDTSSLQA